MELVSLELATFFKIVPMKAELGIDAPAPEPEPFRLNGALLTAPMVEIAAAIGGGVDPRAEIRRGFSLD